jgi:hypothetical protein
MFSAQGFEKNIHHWKSRNTKADHYFDIFDGVMFKELRCKWGTRFCELPCPIFLTLNVDWFQPFDNTSYSCGAIYLSINNLPRGERLKQENVILVGLMPGGSEPNTSDIMSYLGPLVDELVELYNGIPITTEAHPDGITLNAALLLVACDILACRKVGGFLGHGSAFACNKCETKFDMVDGRPDFSGKFKSIDGWKLRTRKSNMEAALKWKYAKSSQERRLLEHLNGRRYSELHRLSYFDVVRQSVVDLCTTF